MVRMGPQMGPRLGPTLGPNPAAGDPLAGFSSVFTTTFGDGFLYLDGNYTIPTGAGPFRLTTTGILPQDLSTGVDYWLINTNSGGLTDTYQVAVSYADAIASAMAELTDDGTGTHTITYTG